MSDKQRIIIIGGGFGGAYCAQALEKKLGKLAAQTEILLINRTNYFVFYPLLMEAGLLIKIIIKEITKMKFITMCILLSLLIGCSNSIPSRDTGLITGIYQEGSNVTEPRLQESHYFRTQTAQSGSGRA